MDVVSGCWCRHSLQFRLLPFLKLVRVGVVSGAGGWPCGGVGTAGGGCASGGGVRWELGDGGRSRLVEWLWYGCVACGGWVWVGGEVCGCGSVLLRGE